jgi:hypothetical protein
MSDLFNYLIVMAPQLLKVLLYSIASICMGIGYFKLKKVGRQSGNQGLVLLATGFGFYFLSFAVALLMSAIGLVFAKYLGELVYYGIQYSEYIFTIIGTVYFVVGAKRLVVSAS